MTMKIILCSNKSLADCKNKIVRDILTEFYDRKADDGDVTKQNF